jgi:hypothetical protein
MELVGGARAKEADLNANGYPAGKRLVILHGPPLCPSSTEHQFCVNQIVRALIQINQECRWGRSLSAGARGSRVGAVHRRSSQRTIGSLNRRAHQTMGERQMNEGLEQFLATIIEQCLDEHDMRPPCVHILQATRH